MRIETDIRHEIDAKRQFRSADAAIATLAARQHGVVARSQLVALGLGHGEIDHRVARRRLHPLHRGVFAVGHRAISRDAAWMAATLAGGAGAVLSHVSAGALWGIRSTDSSRIHVSVPRQRRSRGALVFHHLALPTDETTVHHGIPATTPARTLLDLAALLTPHRVERAIDQAEILRLTSPTSLAALVARHPSARGSVALKRILATHRIGEHLTRGDLENAFLAFLDAHGLPRPRTNQRVELPCGNGPEVDCLWPDRRLIVELDGFETHRTRAAFERDRERDRMLHAAGYRVVRITWRQLTEQPKPIAHQLRALLAPTPASTPS